MSRAMASACDLRSGITAPRREAARTASAMSCGLIRIAGGGLAPMRWSAARTSAIASRRLSRERASVSALPLREASRSSAAASPRSASCTFAVVSISAAESRARSARIDSNCDSMARRCSSDARIVSSTPRSSVSFSAFCCSIGGVGRRGIGARHDRAAQGRTERGGAESQLQSSASPHHQSRPRPSNVAGIAAVKRDDRDGRKESSSPGKAARPPSPAQADAARSWRRI